MDGWQLRWILCIGRYIIIRLDKLSNINIRIGLKYQSAIIEQVGFGTK